MRHGWKSFALTACTPLGLPTDGGGCTLMAKVEVNGGREDPVWTFLKAGGKDVSWNFAAFFVVGKEGQVWPRHSRDLAEIQPRYSRDNTAETQPGYSRGRPRCSRDTAAMIGLLLCL